MAAGGEEAANVVVHVKEEAGGLQQLEADREMDVVFANVSCWVSGHARGRAWHPARPGRPRGPHRRRHHAPRRAAAPAEAGLTSSLQRDDRAPQGTPLRCATSPPTLPSRPPPRSQVPRTFGPPSTLASLKNLAALPGKKKLGAAEAAAKEDMRQV